MKFGDEISWENHVRELLANEKDRLYYIFDENNDIIKHLRKYIQKGKLVDCGCHIGRWIRFFEGAGFDYTGVDQSLEAIKIAQQYNPKGKFVNKFLWDMDFKKEFDIAVCIAVLQHNTLKEKEMILPRINGALKKGGIFFITESTVLKETRTQLTYRGWIDLIERNGFKFLESWHINDCNIHDFYIFEKS